MDFTKFLSDPRYAPLLKLAGVSNAAVTAVEPAKLASLPTDQIQVFKVTAVVRGAPIALLVVSDKCGS